MSFNWLILLPLQFIRDELKKIIFRDVFHLICRLSLCLKHKPLEYFLKSILTTLLIGDVIAETGLLIELGKRVCSLFEAYFETI